MIPDYKGVSIELSDTFFFRATIKGKQRSFDSIAEAHGAIDRSERGWLRNWAGVLSWGTVFILWLGWLVLAYVNRPKPALPAQQGAVITGQCAIAPHKEATVKTRTVADLGLNEAACAGGVFVDKENRAYVRKDGKILTGGVTDCATMVMKRADGYWLKCGDGITLTPFTFVGAGMDFAFPIKGFF